MQSRAEHTVRQIEPDDRLTGLSLGDEEFLPLKIFLQRHAKSFHERHLARTYAAFSGSKVIGYVTLVCGEIALEGDAELLHERDFQYNYKSYPALKIARLAVDARQQRGGLGRLFVQLAIGTAKDTISPAAGCRFVAVDSKRGAVAFYERQGFTLLDTPENRRRSEPVMFLDLYKAAS